MSRGSAAGIRRRAARAPAPLLVVAATVSVQLAAALATSVFDVAGPLGFVWIRVALAALVLCALHARALRLLRSGPLWLVLAMGVTVAVMNVGFYEAIDRIPLGLAVTVGFLGPLAVAVAGSRRPLDFVWVALAGVGVALLGSPGVELDPVGLGFAGAAAVGWASYILLAKRALAVWPIGPGLALTMVVAAVLIAPFGLAAGGSALLDGRLLAIGVVVAVFGSVIPFTLELAALRRLSARAFGILMSVEPATAAVVGALALGQVLGGVEVLAIACVIVASAGASAGARRARPPEI